MSTTDPSAEKPTTTPAVVIYNGPSRAVIQGLKFPGSVVGCNFAYRDFDLTHCMAVDLMTMAAIRGELEDKPYPCEFWTKTSSLELPEPWQQRPQLGIDSGSAAIELALTLTRGPVIVVGADGVSQLTQIIEATKNLPAGDFPEISCDDESLVDPSRWAVI